MTSFYPSGHALQRAAASLRHEGVGAFAFKLASELGYRRVLLLERLLDDPIGDPAPAMPVEFALLAEDEIDDYLVLRPEADRARIVEHLAAGWTCAVLRLEDRIVSACWSAAPPYWSAYLERPMPVEPGDVYLTDAWTDARHRGHALAHVLCLHQLHHFRALGFRRALRGTIPENLSALRVHAKSGFRVIAMLGRLRIGPWRRHFRRDLPGA
jgi:ribosomal protein S18 acetylase RimI-like enzyme